MNFDYCSVSRVVEFWSRNQPHVRDRTVGRTGYLCGVFQGRRCLFGACLSRRANNDRRSLRLTTQPFTWNAEVGFLYASSCGPKRGRGGPQEHSRRLKRLKGLVRGTQSTRFRRYLKYTQSLHACFYSKRGTHTRTHRHLPATAWDSLGLSHRSLILAIHFI